MRKIFRDETHQEEFKKKGYVKVNFLNNEMIADILKKVQDMRPNDQFDPDGKGIGRTTYHCTFLDDSAQYKKKVSQLIDSMFIEIMDRYLVDFKILTSNFYVKPPGKGTINIHQNWPAIEDINETTLTLWTPLVDVDHHNGALQLVAGSHKIVPDIAAATVPMFFQNFEDALLNKYLKTIPMKAGEGLIFDDSLIHYSGPNYSEMTRYAIQIETMPKECTPVVYYCDQAAGGHQFEIFEVDSDFFVNNSLVNLLQRPSHLKSLGFSENRNQLLSEEQFLEKMKQGDETREKIYNAAIV